MYKGCSLSMAQKKPFCSFSSWYILFLQSTPSTQVTLLRAESVSNLDLLLVYALPFAATNAFSQLEISLGDSFAAKGDFETQDVLQALGACFRAGVTIERRENYDNRKSKKKIYNEVQVDASLECFLPFQFCTLLFPFGHIKSTHKDDEAFVNYFKKSKKWLRVRTSEEMLEGGRGRTNSNL